MQYPKNLLRKKIVNNLARLLFALRNKNNLARLFSKVIFEVILENEKATQKIDLTSEK